MTIQSILTTLCSVSISGSLLVMIALLIVSLLNFRISAKWHYVLWLMVLLRFVIPGGPQSSLSLENLVNINQSPAGDGIAGLVVTGLLPEGAASIAGSAQPSMFATTGKGGTFTAPTMAQLLLGVWVIGIIVILLLTLRSHRRLAEIRRRSATAADPVLLVLLAKCQIEARTSRDVSLLISDEVDAPMLTGLRRPVIILPHTVLLNRSNEELRFILCHELVHLRRGDLWIALVAAVIRSLHWFNPLVWLAENRLRSARELACDAAVIKMVGFDNAVAYGHTLLTLSEQHNPMRGISSAVGIMEVKSETGKRINMICRSGNGGRRKWALGLVTTAVLLLVSFTKAEQTSQHVSQAAKLHEENATVALSTIAPSDKGLMVGKVPFKLTVDPKDGELQYLFDETTKGLKTITALRGVTFSTDVTTITGELLTYTVKDAEIKVTGPELKVEMYGLTMTADDVTYWPEKQELYLEGEATVYQKDSDGRVTATSGDDVRINFVNGRLQFRIKSGAPDGN